MATKVETYVQDIKTAKSQLDEVKGNRLRLISTVSGDPLAEVNDIGELMLFDTNVKAEDVIDLAKFINENYA